MFLILGLFQTADESVRRYLKTDSVFICKFLLAFSHPLFPPPFPSSASFSQAGGGKKQRGFQTSLERIIKQSYPVKLSLLDNYSGNDRLLGDSEGGNKIGASLIKVS